MIVNVVMSRLTRVPALSFETGSAGRKDTTYRGPEEAFTMTIIWLTKERKSSIIAYIARRLVV